MMEAKDGSAITDITPSALKTIYNGTPIEIEIDTNYPVEDRYTINVKTSKPVEFTIYVRVPSGADDILIDGAAGHTGFKTVKRIWNSDTKIDVSFSFSPKLEVQPDGMYALWRGPLLYSVPIKERWEKREYTHNGVERKFPYCDNEIFPETTWNYAFAGGEFKFNTHDIGNYPFSPDMPPVTITAPMAEIEWKMLNGVCEEKPDDNKAISDVQNIEMVPYGCTNLRMTQMPKIDN